MIGIKNDLASEIRRLVTTRKAAEFYGFHPNRSNFLSCPFHSERTASLKLFDDGGWRCFGCGEGGSVIDFVMRLFDLSFPQAVIRIDSDFRLGLTSQRPDRMAVSKAVKERRAKLEKRDALETKLRSCNAEHRYWWEVLKWFSPSREDLAAGYIHPLYAEAIIAEPRLDGLCDELADQLYEMKKRGVKT